MSLMPFEAIVGGRELRLVHQDEIIKWAQDALEAGLDTAALRELAGCVASMGWSEFDMVFKKACKENGQAFSRTKAIYAYARWIAELITRSEVSEDEGCMQLQRICVAAGYPSSLPEWVALEAEMNGIGTWSYKTKAEWQAAVRSEAEAMLRSQSS